MLPELTLGAHEIPLHTDAGLTPTGLARLLVEVLDGLSLARVDVIGVDTGGARAQLLMAHHRDRVRHAVLTACDAYEDFLRAGSRPRWTSRGCPAYWLSPGRWRARVRGAGPARLAL